MPHGTPWAGLDQGPTIKRTLVPSVEAHAAWYPLGLGESPLSFGWTLEDEKGSRVAAFASEEDRVKKLRNGEAKGS